MPAARLHLHQASNTPWLLRLHAVLCRRWVLRFELTVGKPVDYSTGSLRMDVSSMQQLSWVLPLVVQVPG
jgi:hypothetical protein